MNAAPRGEEGKEPGPEELERQVGGLLGQLIWAAGMGSALAWGRRGWPSCAARGDAGSGCRSGTAHPCAARHAGPHPPRPPPAHHLTNPAPQFWRNVTLNPPLYGADVPGSLFDPGCKVGTPAGGRATGAGGTGLEQHTNAAR